MRAKGAIMSFLVLAVAALCLSGSAAAARETMSPGEVVTDTIDVSKDDVITISWDTTPESVLFQMRDPNGDLVKTMTDNQYFEMYTADLSGVYTLTWTNNNAVTVTIDYTTTRIPFGDGEDFFDDIWGAIIIIAVVAVVIIVVIIVLVVFVLAKEKKPATPPAQPYMASAPPPIMGPAQPGAPSSCPRCGAALDPSGAFCQRCGARVR